MQKKTETNGQKVARAYWDARGNLVVKGADGKPRKTGTRNPEAVR